MGPITGKYIVLQLPFFRRTFENDPVHPVRVERLFIELGLVRRPGGGPNGGSLVKRHWKHSEVCGRGGKSTSLAGISGVSGMIEFPTTSNLISTFSMTNPGGKGSGAATPTFIGAASLK
ncbi:MAG: hypothetical protein L0220_19610 [Acidobacteria bacterium]|nr:hypothetical protein [Acidobacteriota bacterium]